VKVTLIARTIFHDWKAEDAIGGRWQAEGMTGGDLVEFAARACYQSWNKPNPATATNATYLANVIDHGHLSVLEHASASFYIEDVSRSLTHELVRHRHHSPSQLSQRFVKLDSTTGPVIPPLFVGDDEAMAELQDAWEYAAQKYENLVTLAERRMDEFGLRFAGDKTLARKRVREAARAVLPNMTPTALVLTGNHRAWRDFLTKRGEMHVDLEMRALAEALFHELRAMVPNLYQDMTVAMALDGFSGVIVKTTT
jgi:thymidylate synthase (FAD)